MRGIIQKAAIAGRALCLCAAFPGLAAAQEASGTFGDPNAELPLLSDSVKNLTLLSVPSATVAPSGLVFASLGLTSKRQGTIDDWDGSLALGMGFGDADNTLGAQLTAHITSLENDFADSGYLSLRLSRRVGYGKVPVYVGAEVEGLAKWGQASPNPTSGSVMVSWFPVLETAGGDSFPLMFTAGYGSHRRNNDTDPAPFFGAGIGLTPSFGLSASWTGDTLDLGTSFVFEGVDWFNVSAEINDVTDRLGTRRFSINFNFFRPGFFRS